jgi:hypothetical protein
MSNTYTEIPGTCARRAVITDACRTGRGDMEAFEEAVSRLRDEYRALCTGWPVGKQAQLHVALILERP